MSRLRRDSSFVSEQELDLEASTALLNRSNGRRNIKKIIQDYGYKRLAIDLLIFCAKLGVLIGLAQLINYVFMLKYCDFIFRCGCTWAWAGGVSKCNIHNPDGPHCPWCAATFPATLAIGPLTQASLIISYFLFEWFKWPHFKRVWLKLLLSIAMFFGVGLVSALIFKLATDYPYFLVQ
jgi:hypothetical protein